MANRLRMLSVAVNSAAGTTWMLNAMMDVDGTRMLIHATIAAVHLAIVVVHVYGGGEGGKDGDGV